MRKVLRHYEDYYDAPVSLHTPYLLYLPTYPLVPHIRPSLWIANHLDRMQGLSSCPRSISAPSCPFQVLFSMSPSADLSCGCFILGPLFRMPRRSFTTFCITFSMAKRICRTDSKWKLVQLWVQTFVRAYFRVALNSPSHSDHFLGWFFFLYFSVCHPRYCYYTIYHVLIFIQCLFSLLYFQKQLPRLVACADQASMSVLSNQMGDGDQTGDKLVGFFPARRCVLG